MVEPTDEETETRAGLIIPANAEVRCRSGIVSFDVRLAGTGQKVVRRHELSRACTTNHR